MNTKRLFVLLIGLAFFVALITSCLFIFSIKTVKTEFSVSNGFNETQIQTDLDEFVGKNLLGFKEEKVYSVLSKYPNLKIESVKKTFPNVLEVKIIERLATYGLVYGEETFVLDNEGFIIEKLAQGESYSKNLIKITVSNIDLVNLAVGSKLSTSFNELFYSAITISEANLSSSSTSKIKDCVLEINVSYVGRAKKAVYKTFSGVSIIINKPDEDGVNKAIVGFNKYHELETDYYKTYDNIEVYKNVQTGDIEAVWTSGETKR